MTLTEHCEDIRKGKSMRLFEEMLNASDYPDQYLVRQMCKGFDLLGPIPDSGVLPRKLTTATLTEADVCGVADLNRESIWASTKQCRDLEIAKEVHRSTLQELEKGRLVGLFALDSLPPGCLLSRRFGVSQTTTDAALGQITKITPIDDFTESLANLTNSGNETIAPHGIDVVISSMCLRVRLERKMGRQPAMVARTIDL